MYTWLGVEFVSRNTEATVRGERKGGVVPNLIQAAHETDHFYFYGVLKGICESTCGQDAKLLSGSIVKINDT